MTELSIGVALKETYNFLSEIYSDTSKFLTIVEDYMKSYNFISLWGSPAFWDRSQAYYGDYGWLCHYFSRLYVPKNPNDKKPSLSEKICMFINVYLVPNKIEQPIILSGITKVSEDDFFKSWKETMCDNYGPEFVTTDFLESWEVVKIGGDSALQELVFKVRPLIEVNDQVKTRALCDEVIHKFRDMRA
jgi:hypothetical protein